MKADKKWQYYNLIDMKGKSIETTLSCEETKFGLNNSQSIPGMQGKVSSGSCWSELKTNIC